jgi:hypothetical protein
MKKQKPKGAARTAAYVKEVTPLRPGLRAENAAHGLARSSKLSPAKNSRSAIDCPADEYRDHALGFVQTASHEHRQVTDFIADFGNDAVADKTSHALGPG